MKSVVVTPGKCADYDLQRNTNITEFNEISIFIKYI